MHDSPHHPHQAPIPESLRKQLDAYRRTLWRIKVTEAILAGLFGLLVSYLVVFGLDRLWTSPAMVRLAILLGGAAMFAVFAPYWLHRWVFGHRREDQLARLIARRFPGLGDRLLGVVELQDQAEAADSLSPRLRGAAMEMVAEEAKHRDLAGALPPSAHRRWSLGVLALIAVAATVLTLTPRAGLSSLKRWLFPLSDTPRYTFTLLDHVPSRLVVPFGEAFPLELRLAADSEWRPADGSARFGTQAAVHAPLTDRSYHFEFPGQQAAGTVQVEIGDARHAIEVVPTLRPSAEHVAATIIHPAYLQLPPREVDLRTGVLNAVEGSQVRFQLQVQANRTLSSATLGPATPVKSAISKEKAPAPATEPPAPAAAVAMTVKGNTATSAEIPVTGPAREIPFAWRDEFNLAGESGFRVRLEPVPDAPPVVYLQGIERQRVMLAEETVEFEVLAEDDFGVQHSGIEWQGEFTRPTDQAPAKGEMKLAPGAPTTRRLTHAAAFSPAALGIQPQKLTLRAWTEDYLPKRGRVYSDPVILFVLTRDEHAQMLKGQFDRVIGELEDLARRETDLNDENQRLEKLEGEKLQEPPNRERLGNQKDSEHENTEHMRDLGQRMEQLFKDANRNGDIDKETMKKLAESMQSMQELGNQDMPKVEKKLGDAADQRNTPEQAKKDVQKAVEEQQKVLEKMKKAIDQANEANRNFEASTFVNRLKKAASEQDGVAAALIESFERAHGLRREELDPSDLRKLDDLVRQQSQTASDVRWIQEDLGHFFARTQKPVHHELMEAMRESKIDLALDDNRQRLTRNEGFRATDSSRYWANQLREWAKKLEGDKKQGSGGGGGGGESPEDEDFEFMLRVMHMVQSEQDLRSRTRVLEQLRRSTEQSPPKLP